MSDPDLARYYEQAVSWDSDRLEQALRSASRAWKVAGAGWFCAVAGALALVLLVPLKSVEPFLIRVDGRTGIVDLVPTLDGTATVDEAVTRYLVTHYVSTCERFLLATAESDYQECGAFHSAQRNQSWYALWDRNNPQSPLNVHRDGGSVEVQVESVSFFTRGNGTNDLAQVRYARLERPVAGAAPRRSFWIASVQYAYGRPSADTRLRRWNPLGFRVLEFQKQAEVRDAMSTEGIP